MRHRPELTPPMRLIVIAIQTANNKPYGIRELTEATGASSYTVGKTVSSMAKKGFLIKAIVDTSSVFTVGALPQESE